MLIHWIWLATRNGVSDRVRKDLLEHFRDPEDMYYAAEDAFDHLEELTREARDALADKDLGEARQILDRCARSDIHILTYRDAAYPVRLKNIPDPPMVLYYRGNLPDCDASPLIGVVGTRKASAYGLGVAKRMGYQIAKCGGTVVSGMASGIDSAAMQAALTAGGCVIGVLGCGVDVVYPQSNRGLYADAERYGCLISEFPPGSPPEGWHFPKRNRIISGISCGTLVVEAPLGSGSLITAQSAADQGRDVFVVPGNIDVSTFVGSNRLIREGATLVTTGWEIMEEYEAQYPDKIIREERAAKQAGYPDEAAKTNEIGERPERSAKKRKASAGNEEKSIDNSGSAPYSDVNKPKPALSETEQRIVDALTGSPRLVDDVIAETGLPTAGVLSTLTMLEIRGILVRHPGKRISLK